MPSQVRITPWVDPVIDVLGHDPRSWYVETFWLPTLGPTSLLLLRHLADRFEEHPEGLALPVADTAAALGLGPRDGEQSPLVRTIDRLHQFDLAQRLAPDVIAVRRVLPPVNRRHVRRLPVALQARPATAIGSPARPPTVRSNSRAAGRGVSHSRCCSKARPSTRSSARCTAAASTLLSRTKPCGGLASATAPSTKTPAETPPPLSASSGAPPAVRGASLAVPRRRRAP